MRYWGFLLLKLLVIAGIAYGGSALLSDIFPSADDLGASQLRFRRDFNYSFAMLGWFLFCFGLLYAAILDTRYRCRTCLRRLRMPVNTGSWANLLFGHSKLEYICPFGHGTLKVPEIQITGPHPHDWENHGDIWEELFTAGRDKK